MIGLLVATLAGWRRWPLWAPIAIALLGLPLALYKWHVAGAWRAEAGLLDLDLAAQMISAALGLALLYGSSTD